MKTKKGLYEEWIENNGLELVRKWAKLGLSNKQISENMGVKERTFYSWLKKYPEFQRALNEAKTIPNLDIEISMLDLACGRAYVEETKIITDLKTGEPIREETTRKQLPPNAATLNFLAKNRMRDKYRDYCPIDDSNVNGEDIQQDIQIYMPDR